MDLPKIENRVFIFSLNKGSKERLLSAYTVRWLKFKSIDFKAFSETVLNKEIVTNSYTSFMYI